MLPNPVLTFGKVHVYMYGIMIALGILACFFVLFEYCKRVGINGRYVDFAFYDGIASIVIGFIGAALWQATFNYIEDMNEYHELIDKGFNAVKPEFDIKGGITAIGGLATGALTYVVIALIFRKKYPFMLTKTVMVAPCCMVIAHAFGRIGCFCAGCCYGKEATGFWSFLGVYFKGGDGAGVLRYPTQLFEAIFLFILFGVMSFLLLKKKFKYNLVVYLASYGVWRFLIEFIRDDHRGSFIAGLSPSQAQSIVLVLIAIPVFFLLRYYNQKMALYEANGGNTKNAEVKDENECENKDVKTENKDNISEVSTDENISKVKDNISTESHDKKGKLNKEAEILDNEKLPDDNRENEE